MIFLATLQVAMVSFFVVFLYCTITYIKNSALVLQCCHFPCLRTSSNKSSDLKIFVFSYFLKCVFDVVAILNSSVIFDEFQESARKIV